MKDKDKTKAELIKELNALRKELGESALNDITDRKRTEEALYESQQEFSSLFKSSPEALVYVDEKSNILNINSQFTKLFGYSLKEIKGKNVDNGIIHSQKMIHEGKNLTKKALEGFVNYETIRKRKDGSEFPVFISSAPVKINNKSKGIITLYQDITERRKAEEKLRQSEEKFVGIFKNIPDENEKFGKLSAGKLLEDAGVKELSVGGARVFEKNANIIINCGTAKSDDIKKLINQMRRRVS